MNKVIRSINLSDHGLCVDLFQRPNGSLGFEEYRRDPEDPRGWYPIGAYRDQTFDSIEEALRVATLQVAWLKDVLP